MRKTATASGMKHGASEYKPGDLAGSFQTRAPLGIEPGHKLKGNCARNGPFQQVKDTVANANQSPFAKISAGLPCKKSAPLGKSGNTALFEMKSGGKVALQARFRLQNGKYEFSAIVQPAAGSCHSALPSSFSAAPHDCNRFVTITSGRPCLCIAFLRDFSAAFLSRIFAIPGRYETALPASPLFPLTIPQNQRITWGMRAYGRKTGTIPSSEWGTEEACFARVIKPY